MSSAKITIWDTTVGYISWDERNHTAIFEAEKAYLDSPLNIAPLLHPDKKSLLFGNNFHEKFLGMIPTFNDSFPIRLVMWFLKSGSSKSIWINHK